MKTLKERIQKAAETLVIEQGVQRTTLEQVANLACTTKMGICRIFKNKENLIKSVFEALDEQTQKHWQNILLNAPSGTCAIETLFNEQLVAIKNKTYSRGCPLALSSAEHNEYGEHCYNKTPLNSELKTADQLQNDCHANIKSQKTNSNIDTANEWVIIHSIAQRHKEALCAFIEKCLEKDNIPNKKEIALLVFTIMNGIYLNKNSIFFENQNNELKAMLKWLIIKIKDNSSYDKIRA